MLSCYLHFWHSWPTADFRIKSDVIIIAVIFTLFDFNECNSISITDLEMLFTISSSAISLVFGLRDEQCDEIVNIVRNVHKKDEDRITINDVIKSNIY